MSYYGHTAKNRRREKFYHWFTIFVAMLALMFPAGLVWCLFLR